MTIAINEIPTPICSSAGWPWESEFKQDTELPEGCAWPKITIVTPSYNQGAFLEKAIRSVLMQGYPELEYIVIDGGSKDNSLEVLERYGDCLTSWTSEPDRGQSHAINKGMASSNGELLGWLNSDDYLLPGALFRLAQAFLEDRSVGAVYGQGHIVDEDGEVVYEPNMQQVTEESLYSWFSGGAEFMQPSCYFTRDAWVKCGPLSEELDFAMDLDLWIRIAKSYDYRKIEDLLSISLKHDDAKTTSDKELARVEVGLVYALHGNIRQAKVEMEKLAVAMIKCRKQIKDIYSLPLVLRLIKLVDRDNKIPL